MSPLNSIASALLKVVKAYPFHECKQPNSFAFIASEESAKTANFGMTIRDYKKGFFWGRAFEGQGANEGDVKIEYPSVYLSMGEMFNAQYNNNCISFEVGIIDTHDCITCSETCSRTKAELIFDLYATLENIRKELESMNIYNVDGIPNWGNANWANQMQIDYPNQAVELTSNELYRSMKNIRPARSKSIGDNNEVAVYFQFDFCGCFVDSVGFDYSLQPFELGASVKCDTCN